MSISFKAWSETVETEYTCEFARDGIRDIYTTPFGVKVHDESFLPRHIFGKPGHQTLVDLTLPVSMKPWLLEYGAVLDENRYTPDGFGCPLFRGEDSLEQAFNFIKENHERLNPGRGQAKAGPLPSEVC